MSDHRRRIDIVLEPEYLEGLDTADLAEIRERRDTAEDVEAQISYYRRLIHGRMDLLAFELKRRRGEEERSLIEALPEILSAGLVLGDGPSLKYLDTMPPLPSTTGRRLIDRIMEDGILTQLPDLADRRADLRLHAGDHDAHGGRPRVVVRPGQPRDRRRGLGHPVELHDVAVRQPVEQAPLELGRDRRGRVLEMAQAADVGARGVLEQERDHRGHEDGVRDALASDRGQDGRG